MQRFLEREEAFLAAEVSKWESSGSEKGQVYTRPEVVSYMLTCIGLGEIADISTVSVLEPSCGEGEFSTEIIKRLITLPAKKPTAKELAGRFFAMDIVGSSVAIARGKASDLLLEHGYTVEEIAFLVQEWFFVGDFLLEDIARKFRFIIGNPPYVRVENIPKVLLAEYRKRFATMSDRADLYVPFFERALSLLEADGKLSFICTDRWTKNTYGRNLRELIYNKFSLELYIDLYGIEAFESSVMTYPAITQVSNSDLDQTVLLHNTSFSESEAFNVARTLAGTESNLYMRKGVVNGSKPWLLGAADEIDLVRRIENKFPLLEAVGCKVYIGAATGANKVYVVDKNSVDIEESRLLPVITASEIKRGSIIWKGHYIVNTYDASGVVSLNDYPKLASYLNSHRELLGARHIAASDQIRWYKTIDRVYEERCKRPKLLIPDISSDPVVVYDAGNFHPNNSIYYICSDSWDLHALKVIMLSRMTKLFVTTYSTKIANGYLRFQAQHLRKICIPEWATLDSSLQNELIRTGKAENIESYDRLAFQVYGLDAKEMEVLGA